MSEIVLDDGQNIINENREIGNKKTNARGNSISALMADRNGNPPSQEELQKFQNKLMGRAENFQSLPNDEKERIMFQELQDWHFSNMPSIEQMKADIEKHPLQYEVKSFEEKDVKGVNNPHINIKNQNITLTVMSDGKKIQFNNAQLLEQYREAIQKQNTKDKGASDTQTRGAQAHMERTFDD